MPFIKMNKAQQVALEEINEKLDILARLVPLLGEEDDDLSITISIGKGRGGAKISLSNKDKERKKVLAALEEYRRRMAKDIKDKAKRYSIELTEEEEALLGSGKLPASDTDAEDESGNESSILESDEEDATGDASEDLESNERDISHTEDDEIRSMDDTLSAGRSETHGSAFSAERARFGEF